MKTIFFGFVTITQANINSKNILMYQNRTKTSNMINNQACIQGVFKSSEISGKLGFLNYVYIHLLVRVKPPKYYFTYAPV